jgi:hypothetical protein
MAAKEMECQLRKKEVLKLEDQVLSLQKQLLQLSMNHTSTTDLTLDKENSPPSNLIDI